MKNNRKSANAPESASKLSSAPKHNAQIEKCTFFMGGLGVILPFFLPEASWLADLYLFQRLGAIIPSASELAKISIYPHVVFVYVVSMLTVAFFLGIWSFMLIDSWRYFARRQMEENPKKSKVILWLRAVFGFFFFLGLLALFYILPGEATADPRGGKGQLIVSLMVMTKPGLAIFGAIASAGVYGSWLCLFITFSNIFIIPFQKINTTLNKE